MGKRLLVPRIGFVGCSGAVAERVAKSITKHLVPEHKFCYKTQSLRPTLMASNSNTSHLQFFNSLGFTTTVDPAAVFENAQIIVINDPNSHSNLVKEAAKTTGKFVFTINSNKISKNVNDVSESEFLQHVINYDSSTTATSFSTNLPLLSKSFEIDLNHIVGYGRYGKVYLGKCNKTGKAVAIKTVDAAVKSQEVNALKALSHHDSFAKFYGAFSNQQQQLCIVTEFLQGPTLYDLIVKNRRGLEESKVKDIIRNLLVGIQEMHSKCIIHRDIKPENVILSNRPVLVDFGLGVLLQRQSDVRHTMCGTIGYVSPEMARGHVYNTSTDIWSTGVLTYTLLTGTPPFHHHDDSTLLRMISSGFVPYSKWDQVSQDFVSQMLVTDPMLRASATELLDHPWLRQR